MEMQKGNKKTAFFYFHPTGVNHDNISSQFSRGISNLYDFPIDCHYHGVCIDKKSLVKVLNWNANDGIDYSNKWKKEKIAFHDFFFVNGKRTHSWNLLFNKSHYS